MKKQYLNFGAGDPAPDWINLDSSPYFLAPKFIHQLLTTLNVSKRSEHYTKHHYQYYKFHEDKKLPFKSNSLEGIYISHVLEHLSLEEIEAVLKECKRILKKNGVVRILLPDLDKKYHSNNDAWVSLEKELLTLPQELKTNRFRALLEAWHGFPSFHKSLLKKSKITSLYNKDWKVETELNYLESNIHKDILKKVEIPSRLKDAIVFELVKK